MNKLEALRKGAPANTRLTVSRPAKAHRRPVTYAGRGNIHRYIKNALPGLTVSQLKTVVELAEVYAETKNSGITPDIPTLKELVAKYEV